MKNQTVLRVLTAIVFVMMISAGLQAQRGQRPQGPPDEAQIKKMVEKLSTALSLSEDQKLKVLVYFNAHFKEMEQLMKAGNTNFIVGPANPPESAATDYRIAQGMIELSNVDAVRMMTELIETLRGFESYQKVISAIDEVNALAIKEVGEAY